MSAHALPQAKKDKGATYIGEATHFASHAWSYNFDELLATLMQLEETEKEPEKIFFWLDVASVNQHKVH